jgi:prepilin-type N-terminal cleavage/methylation domain-containing protein
MDYQVNFKKINTGFSLVELIMVIGIFSLIISISTSGFNSFKSHSNLAIGVGGVVEAIRLAQSSAQSGKGDSAWGVKILSDEVVVFKGSDYSGRDTSFDEHLNFQGGVSASGLSEIIFEKITGKTVNVGDVFISNTSGEQKLSINSFGTINYLNVVPVNPQGCTGTPWGDVVEGYSNTAYLTSSVDYPLVCISENRTCNAGTMSGSYTNTSCSVVNYPMSKWSFDEGSGCVANDLYGINGGVLGINCPTVSPSWVAGKTGSALSFNGTSNNVSINNSVNLNFTTSMSVSAWIKWNVTPSTGVAYATIVNKNGDNQYRLQHNATNSKFEFGIKTNTGSTYVTSTTTPVVGVWYHLVGTWDGNLVKIYVNGILEQTGTRVGALLSSTSPLKIASFSADYRYFNGIIDEVSFWDRALSQQEIIQIFSSNL